MRPHLVGRAGDVIAAAGRQVRLGHRPVLDLARRDGIVGQHVVLHALDVPVEAPLLRADRRQPDEEVESKKRLACEGNRRQPG